MCTKVIIIYEIRKRAGVKYNIYVYFVNKCKQKGFNC